MDNDQFVPVLMLSAVGLLILMYNHLQLLEEVENHMGRGRGRRRWWVRPVNRARERQGFYHNLITETQLADHEEFFANVRMWPEQFEFLHNILQSDLERQSTNMREALPSRLRLGLTLMYLAQGGTAQSLHDQFRVGRSTTHLIVGETCKAIWLRLQPIFLPEPTIEDMKRMADEFFERWQLPNCFGAVDGRHMRIKAPPLSGSQFFNYKGFFSIVLLAVVDAHYRFTFVDVGQYGSMSDGGIWSNSELGQALENGELELPPDRQLPGDHNNVPFPYFIAGDEAFPLKKYLMRPYPGRMQRNLPDVQRIINYRLSRARRVSENSFGILAIRWQVLNSALVCAVEKAEDIVKALVCLHNFLSTNEHGGYMNPNHLEVELADGQIQGGAWRTRTTEEYFRRLRRVGANRATSIVCGMRNHLADYLESDIGAAQAPWQFERAFRGAQLRLPQ